ncbi:tRNA (adenosine(37)-N6)-threonylcarbamoyltransferase complex dimerization subunit type 1 TsaB [Candidatus Margulisiibacteriota bacterium]
MRVLGLSSATQVVSIGLIDEERVLAETTVSALAAEKVMFYIKEAGIEPKQIEGVAVATGPGSYSGLRGGLAAAKTLAQTLKVPLAEVSTLEAIAYNLVDIEGTMAVVLDAKREDYNFALFGAHEGQLKRLTDDLVVDSRKIIEKLTKVSGELHVVGNLKDFKGKLKSKNLHLVDDIHSHPYGINVARLGLLKIKAKETVDPLKLTPKYSHKPNIREYSA